MMEIPNDMKGLEKSITSSRTSVIVRGAIAISAFCWRHKCSSSCCSFNLCHLKDWVFIPLCGNYGVTQYGPLDPYPYFWKATTVHHTQPLGFQYSDQPVYAVEFQITINGMFESEINNSHLFWMFSFWIYFSIRHLSFQWFQSHLTFNILPSVCKHTVLFISCRVSDLTW